MRLDSVNLAEQLAESAAGLMHETGSSERAVTSALLLIVNRSGIAKGMQARLVVSPETLRSGTIMPTS